MEVCTTCKDLEPRLQALEKHMNDSLKLRRDFWIVCLTVVCTMAIYNPQIFMVAAGVLANIFRISQDAPKSVV